MYNFTVSDMQNTKTNPILFLTTRVTKDGEPPTATMEQEKRIRREIANSNERRRMQSINNGFQSLRSLLPHHEGEKLSKVSLAIRSESFSWYGKKPNGVVYLA